MYDIPMNVRCEPSENVAANQLNERHPMPKMDGQEGSHFEILIHSLYYYSPICLVHLQGHNSHSPCQNLTEETRLSYNNQPAKGKKQETHM